ncbi:MAG: hypothetical protein MSA57_06815, partial [Ruminococcus sp.]|nr:hypothetical protein [Ruminococcus sp.]
CYHNPKKAAIRQGMRQYLSLIKQFLGWTYGETPPAVFRIRYSVVLHNVIYYNTLFVICQVFF